jgi:conjugal transfer pilus assembly protein TraA
MKRNLGVTVKAMGSFFLGKMRRVKAETYFLLAAAIILAVPHLAFAGTDTTFGSIYQTLSDWTQGSLGMTIAVGTFLVGMGIGIVRQSLMSIALGIGGALALSYTPTIMSGIFTGLM